MKNKITARFIKYCLYLLLKTCKMEIKGLENIYNTEGPLIIALWHNRLALLAETLSPLTSKYHFTAFVSKSRDGELLSQFVLSYPSTSVIRVGHDTRGFALKAMIDTLRNNNSILLITPDGPRGPAYQLKPGLKKALEESNAQVIPFTWESFRYWELKTWDKFRLPKPFSTIQITFGAPTRTIEDTL